MIDDDAQHPVSVASLERSSLQGVDLLDDEHRRVVGAAAVLGGHATVCAVATIAECTSVDVLSVVDGAAGWMDVCGQRIRFADEVVRADLITALTAVERQQLHAAAMETIPATDADQLTRRAVHAIEAAGLSRTHALAAIETCHEAAVALHAMLSFEDAAVWAERGWRLAAELASPGLEAELRLAHADAVLACGRLVTARRLYEAAVSPAERANDAPLLARAAIGLGGVWVEEQRDELSRRRMLALCRRARAGLAGENSLLAARLSVRLAAEDVYQRGSDDAIVRAVEDVRIHDDPAAIAEALSLYHHTLLVPDRAELRLRVAEELLDVAARPGAGAFALFGLCWRTVDLYLLGDPRAEASYVNLREQADATGSQAIGYVAAVLDVMRTFRRGDLELTEQLAEDALRVGAEAGDADAMSWYGAHLLAVRWAQGRLDEMHELVAAVIESSTLRRFDLVYPALLAYTSALRGDVTTSRAAIETVFADSASTFADFSTWTTTMTVLAETAAALGDAELGADVARRFAPYADLPVMPSLAVICLGPGQRVLATAHAAAGRLDVAVDCLRAAVVANDRIGNRPFAAIILAQLAAVLMRRRQQGDVAEASDLNTRAIALGEEMGMSGRVAQWRRAAAETAPAEEAAVVRATLALGEDGWLIDVAGRSAIVGNVTGMRYVAELVSRPDTSIAAAELYAVATGRPPTRSCRGAQTLDAEARRQYQRRLAELEYELETADVLGDASRSERAVAERDQILDQLRRDVGLGGRARRLDDEAERSRMRVSKAIRRAIAQVDAIDPVLGGMLRSRIHTGFSCRYVSDAGQPIEWTVRIGRRSDER